MAPKKKVVAKMVKPKAVTKVQKVPSKDFKDYLNVFEFDCVLPGTGQKVKFKPLTIGNIKQIASYSEEEPSSGTLTNMFDEIFRNSVITEDFDPLSIYLQDRYFIINDLRIKNL